MSEKPEEFDVFLSHADEDHDIVSPLVNLLRFEYDLKVWYDDDKALMRGTLMESIDYGLKNSRCGVVIVSPTYVFKCGGWIGIERAALIRKEHKAHDRVFFPVWFTVTEAEVTQCSPSLATYPALTLREEREIELIAH